MKKLLFLLTLPALLLFTGCSEDEPEVDFRLQAVGSYNYTATFTLKADANQTDTDTGTLTIALDGNTMTATVDGDVYTLNGVTEGSNGLGFNVNTVTETDDDGDSYQLRGVASSTLGTAQYHGRYDSGSKQLFINFETDYVDNQYDDFNFFIEIIANKK